MNAQGLNLFIVDDNQLMVATLRNYLDTRFGTNLNISTFYSGASALQKVNSDTNIVILDYSMPGENGNEVLKSIKKINPKTEVIMLSNNEDIAVAIDSFREGATDYIVKGEHSWKKLSSLLYKVITYPVRVLVKEFGISKFLAVFVLTFIILGVGVFVALKFAQ